MYLRFELLGLYLQLGHVDDEIAEDEEEPEAETPEEPSLTIVDRQYPNVIYETRPADPIGFRLEPYIEE